MALQPFVEPWPLFSFLTLVDRTPWTGDQLVARPLPAHDSINTKWTQTDIHASSGIRTHDPRIWAGEDSSCLRSRGHCDRPQTEKYEDKGAVSVQLLGLNQWATYGCVCWHPQQTCTACTKVYLFLLLSFTPWRFMGVGGKGPHILNLGIMWRSAVTFTLR
jgi:hypothetical protein